MNRIIKYQESIAKFIKTKSDINNFDESFKTFILEEIKGTNYIFSIILLTTMNNQNKKNKVSLHGYYIASAMEFVEVLHKMIRNSEKYMNKLGNKYGLYMSNIIFSVMMSLTQNIESIEIIAKNNITNVSKTAYKFLNSRLMKLTNLTMKLTHKEEYVKTDISKFHFKDNLLDYLGKIRQVERNELMSYIDNSQGLISEIAFGLGWILGCGEIKALNKISKISLLFGTLIKLTNDFNNLEKDLKDNLSEKIVTYNYILNFGFQNAFETFVDIKQKFITLALTHDIYTSTLKDITDELEDKIDNIIEETSPDLLSQASL